MCVCVCVCVCVCKKKLDDSVYICDEDIWETGSESVMDERMCVCVRRRLVTRMSEKESRSLDKNVKFPDVKT